MSAPGSDPAGAALERLATAARLGLMCTGGPESPALSAIERDAATVRAALDDRAAAWRIADAASEAAVDARRMGGYPMGGPEA